MTDKQENYLSMCKAVQQTCNANSSSWSSIPAFVNFYSEFNTFVSELDAAKMIQIANITGATLSKESKRNEMSELAAIISSSLTSYALSVNDDDLRLLIDHSYSDLKKLRDELIVSQVQIIHDKALEHKGELGNSFNITFEMIQQLQQLIGEYSVISQLPSVKSDAKETATDLIVEIISKIRKKLEMMDRAVQVLKLTDKNFYTNYKKSREIYDLGKGKKEEPSSPEPVEE